MTDSISPSQQPLNGIVEPQCQYFVLRKKRLCRMTVRPGRQYCGEHEPQPTTADGQSDTRIPCPNDPKHTVYISKLEKHLLICNARVTEQPPYIVPNINAPTEVETCLRKPLSQIPQETVMQVIDKVNFLYDKHVKDNVTTAPEYPIHSAVMEEFSECDRSETSLRHLRQVSSLLWLAEEEGLVGGNTCYVELGAGKGHVSYYACKAWCAAGGGGAGAALLLDRAALRHKRDNKLRGRRARVRADLAHVALQRAPLVPGCDAVLGLAKHLCGVATDYALRCITADGVLHKTRGVVLATCCHHRCERAAFIGNQHLQELGINNEEFNVMLGIVSWATCGDGRSRDSRKLQGDEPGSCSPPDEPGSCSPPDEPGSCSPPDEPGSRSPPDEPGSRSPPDEPGSCSPPDEPGSRSPPDEPGSCSPPDEPGSRSPPDEPGSCSPPDEPGSRSPPDEPGSCSPPDGPPAHAQRARAGRRAKLVLDWARVLALRARGFQARLCYFVPSHVSLENVCIIAKKLS